MENLKNIIAKYKNFIKQKINTIKTKKTPFLQLKKHKKNNYINNKQLISMKHISKFYNAFLFSLIINFINWQCIIPTTTVINYECFYRNLAILIIFLMLHIFWVIGIFFFTGMETSFILLYKIYKKPELHTQFYTDIFITFFIIIYTFLCYLPYIILSIYSDIPVEIDISNLHDNNNNTDNNTNNILAPLNPIIDSIETKTPSLNTFHTILQEQYETKRHEMWTQDMYKRDLQIEAEQQKVKQLKQKALETLSTIYLEKSQQYPNKWVSDNFVDINNGTQSACVANAVDNSHQKSIIIKDNLTGKIYQFVDRRTYITIKELTKPITVLKTETNAKGVVTSSEWVNKLAPSQKVNVSVPCFHNWVAGIEDKQKNDTSKFYD